MSQPAPFVQPTLNSTAQANRLTTIYSHLRNLPKIVITRDLGPEASALIQPKESFEVLFNVGTLERY